MSEYYLTKDELYHYGIKGQKWGVRNYQNEDGSYKSGAEGRYSSSDGSSARDKMLSARKEYRNASRESTNSAYKYSQRATNLFANLTKNQRSKTKSLEDKAYKDYENELAAKQKYKEAKKEYKNSDEYKERQQKIKKAAIAGAAVAATALAAYGIYKYSKARKELAAAEEAGKRRTRELMMSFDSAKSSVEKAKSLGGGQGRNEHYSWKVDKTGNYSIRQLSDREIAKANARAAAERNAEMKKIVLRDAKNGIYNTRYTKSVGYDPRNHK